MNDKKAIEEKKHQIKSLNSYIMKELDEDKNGGNEKAQRKINAKKWSAKMRDENRSNGERLREC